METTLIRIVSWFHFTETGTWFSITEPPLWSYCPSKARTCVLYELIQIFLFLIQTMTDLLHNTSNKLKQESNSCTNTCKHFTQLHHSDFILIKIFYIINGPNLRYYYLTEQEFMFAVLTLRYVVINHAWPTKKKTNSNRYTCYLFFPLVFKQFFSL